MSETGDLKTILLHKSCFIPTLVVSDCPKKYTPQLHLAQFTLCDFLSCFSGLAFIGYSHVCANLQVVGSVLAQACVCQFVGFPTQSYVPSVIKDTEWPKSYRCVVKQHSSISSITNTKVKQLTSEYFPRGSSHTPGAFVPIITSLLPLIIFYSDNRQDGIILAHPDQSPHHPTRQHITSGAVVRTLHYKPPCSNPTHTYVCGLVPKATDEPNSFLL